MSNEKPRRAGQRSEKTRYPGIYRIHARGCKGERCACSYQAAVETAAGKKLRRSFDTLGAAKRWRSEMLGAGREIVAPSKLTVKQAVEHLLAGMADGTIKNRSSRPFKPSVTRRYALGLNRHVLPVLGRSQLADVRRGHVKHLVASWERAGMSPSSIRNNLDPLRVIVREALEDRVITEDPIAGMRLDPARGRRERVADRAEAEQLLAALPASERALWACAFYGGLRRGELRALRWDDVDFDAGHIRVEHGWDDEIGEIATKSDAGERKVPLAGQLRQLLRAHKLAAGRHGDDLVFGRTATLPFIASTVRARARARAAWEQAGLQPITLHEARHSAASYLIEAGLNDLELTAMIGHSDPRTTKVIYGHLFDDSCEKVAAKLDAYLAAGE